MQFQHLTILQSFQVLVRDIDMFQQGSGQFNKRYSLLRFGMSSPIKTPTICGVGNFNGAKAGAACRGQWLRLLVVKN